MMRSTQNLIPQWNIISTPLHTLAPHLKFSTNSGRYRCLKYLYVFILPNISTVISFWDSPGRLRWMFFKLYGKFPLWKGKGVISFPNKTFHRFPGCKSKAKMYWLQWGLVGPTALPCYATLVPSLCSSPWGSTLKDPSVPSSLFLGILYVLVF